MDYNKITNVVLGGFDLACYASFDNAHVFSADYDGIPMNEDQLNEINQDGDFIYEQILELFF